MSTFYDEVLANLTWYELNSNFNDPMYQYMVKLERELYVTVKWPLLRTNYSNQDGFVVFDRNQIPRYGTYQCSTPEKEAYMDSAFSCFLFQLPYFLEKIEIGFIGFAFVIPIMLISIFGGIKESYRWFILNQAIFDLFLCYDFICSRPTSFGWSKNYFLQRTCFYSKSVTTTENGAIIFALVQGSQRFLRNASFIPIFHLAFSRFVCMYFSRFYKNFTKNGYKVLIFMLIFYLFCILIFCVSIFWTASLNAGLDKENAEKCEPMCPSNNLTYCTQNIPEYFRCQKRLKYDYISDLRSRQKITLILKYISFLISPIMFLLSIICTGFLFYKILSQLKFQLKTNPDSFKQTLKISSAVGLQCLTMSWIFVISGIQKYMQVKAEIVDTLKIYDDLPPWLFLLQYYPTTTSLNMIRIILDSCIILTILTGYSKCVVSTLKFAYAFMTNPKKAFKKLKSGINNNSVTVISALKK